MKYGESGEMLTLIVVNTIKLTRHRKGVKIAETGDSSYVHHPIYNKIGVGFLVPSIIHTFFILLVVPKRREMILEN